MRNKSIVAFVIYIILAIFISSCNGGGGGGSSQSSTNKPLMLSFALPSNNGYISGTINQSNNTITVQLPFGSIVNSLKAQFAATDGATVSVDGITQTSSQSLEDFSKIVKYDISKDGQTTSYEVTVTILPDSAKSMVSFSLPDTRNPNNPVISGIINQSNHTISVQLPYGASSNNLAAIFVAHAISVKINGIEQQSGVTINNFSSSIVYTLTAADGSTVSYTVTITTANPSSNTILTFSIPGQISSSINGTSISVVMPYGTNLHSLVANFSFNGKTLLVGDTVQISGVSSNDFSSQQVSYLAIAYDNSTVTYSVTVTIAASNNATLNAFDLPGEFNSLISGRTITITMPTNTSLANLKAIFTTNNASSVKIGSTTLISSSTEYTYSNSNTITVTAQDGVTQIVYRLNIIFANAITPTLYFLGDSVFTGKTYSIKLQFKNTGSSTVNLGADEFVVPNGVTWMVTQDGCKNISFTIGSICEIDGTFTSTQDSGAKKFGVLLQNTANEIAFNFSKDIYTIPYKSGYQAILIKSDTNTTHTIYAAATVSTKMISFNSQNEGTITSSSSDTAPSYSTYATTIITPTQNYSVLYIPPNSEGGVIYVSVDNKLSDGGAPSDTGADANNNNTRWQTFEYFFNNNEYPSNINSTNVNRISLPIILSIVAKSPNNGITPDGLYTVAGIKYDPTISSATILSQIANALNAYPNMYANLVRHDNNGNIVRILSPADVYPFFNTPTSPYYMDVSAFTPYIDDVWNYYKTHDLVMDMSNYNGNSNCIITGRVGADNLLKFTSSTGTCNPDNYGTYQTPTFTKFTAIDFLAAASRSDDTTWGPNPSYRAEIGKIIVAAQTAGLFPNCEDTNFIYGHNEIVAVKSEFYTPHYSSCGFADYSQYTDKVINQYVKQNSLYFNYYGYGYSDVLGEDGSLYDLDYTTYPMTVTIGKLD